MGNIQGGPYELQLQSSKQYLQNFTQETLPMISQMHEHEYTVKILLVNKELPISFMETLHFSVTIVNLGYSAIPNNSTFQVTSPSYIMDQVFTFPGAVLQAGEATFNFTMSSLLNSDRYNNFLKYNPVFHFQLATPMNRTAECYYDSFIVPYHFMTKELLNSFKPVIKPELLIFGWVGSGKSTFLNCLMTYFHNEYQNRALCGNFSSHVTQTANRYENDKTFITDTKGMTSENYTGEEFQKLLRNISLVIFVVKAQVMHDPVAIKRLEDCMRTASYGSGRLILIITHADQYPNDRSAVETSFGRISYQFLGCQQFFIDLSRPSKSIEQDKVIGEIIYHIFSVLS